ncbi:hypothetical protein [Pseudomonas sp. GW704-F2]|uniref:hypothetical protein n=1 Tax=Pseudomonas sp. GW704-F2 TaxID=2070577 RepID=UPI001304DD19|nr:hypothetical protein [Pseudomonas sp. GW704-F2]
MPPMAIGQTTLSKRTTTIAGNPPPTLDLRRLIYMARTLSFRALDCLPAKT